MGVPDEITEDERQESGGKWEPIVPKSVHHQILRLAHLGYKNIEIAELVSRTPQTVSNIVTSEAGKRKLEIFTGAADASTLRMQEEILKRAPLALDVLDEILMDDEVSAGIRSGIARDILDRSGHGAIRRSENKNYNLNRHLTSDDLDEIEARAMELREERGLKQIGRADTDKE